MFNRFNLLGLTVLVIWSSSATMLKQTIINSNGNFLTVVFAYNIVAAAISLLIALIKGEFRIMGTLGETKKVFSLIVLNGFYDVLIAVAVTLSTVVSYAVIANYMWPILLLLFLSIKQRRFSRRSIISGCLGFAAIAIILFPENLSRFSGNFPGIALALGAAVLWALYSSSLEPRHSRISFVIQGCAQAVSGVTVFLLALFTGNFSLMDISAPSALLPILFFALINMNLAYVMWIFVMVRHPQVQKLTSLVYLSAFLSIGISVIWFKEFFNGRIWLAAPLLLLGVIISQRRDRSASLRSTSKSTSS